MLNDKDIKKFFVRRFARIVPLAWLYLIIVFLVVPVNGEVMAKHLFFYANWPPMGLIKGTSHFWSLCVEMQFYIAIGLLVLLFKNKAFIIITGLCVLVTLFRVQHQAYANINTYFRIDEILAGCILALIYAEFYGVRVKTYLAKLNPYVLLVLLIISSHPKSEWVNYFRPYFAALLVGSTVVNRDRQLNQFLGIKIFTYIAAISFALYVIHGGLRYTWLGEGDTLEKYLKRPLLFAVTFLLAHVSTFHFEKKFSSVARRYKSRKQ